MMKKNNVSALEVEGGWEIHVEMQVTAIKHSEQQYWLHKLLVYGDLV